MVKKGILLILTPVFLFGSYNLAFAQQDPIKNNISNGAGIVEVNFFYSAICPHCKAEEKFLDGLEKKYPELEIKRYEVVYHPENQKILQEFQVKYNVPENERAFVPETFTPTKYFVGYNDQTATEIENCLVECMGGGTVVSNKIKIPIFGEVDISRTSLLALTAVLGTMDGFNPCAMWVLVILISMLLAAKSRKKIALVGGTFIFAEGLLYFLFMSAWLNVFLVMGQVSLIRILIGVFGIVFGIWRLRDFATWRPGVCKVTETTKSEGKILDRINKVMKPAALPATILGVIALAFSVNLVEFFCSAGFPVMYTKILSSQGIGGVQYYLYLLLYNFFYMLDDFVVFGFAFFTLNRFGFSDKYNRYSTLVAGLLILILGVLLIFKPNILMFG